MIDVATRGGLSMRKMRNLFRRIRTWYIYKRYGGGSFQAELDRQRRRGRKVVGGKGLYTCF